MHLKLVLIFGMTLILLGYVALDAEARTRSEGNYDIEITMEPDPVEDGQDATFTIKINLLNGDDANGDFSKICLMIGDDTMEPCMERDEVSGNWKGTYTINKKPEMESGDKIPVTVYYWEIFEEGETRTTNPGSWGKTNSAANPDQQFWELTYKNPFYFETEGPWITFTEIIPWLILASLIIISLIAIRIKRPPWFPVWK